jgi:UDP-N-acetyl-D-mannosaminuronate dehydrogenase
VIAILGLAFKGVPQTRDTRGSFGTALLERLRDALPDADIRGWDPAGDTSDNGVRAVAGAAFVVLANDHPALRDPRNLERCAHAAVVFDVCGVLAGEARPDLLIRRFGSGRAIGKDDSCVA